jgi:hypothetical protein
LDDVLAPETEELSRQDLRPFGCLDYLVYVPRDLSDGVTGVSAGDLPELILRERGETHDAGQEVVEVVSDPSDQLTEALQARTSQLLFEELLLARDPHRVADVPDGDADDPLFRLLGGQGYVDGEIPSVLVARGKDEAPVRRSACMVPPAVEVCLDILDAHGDEDVD